jgi:hypothetical protein
VDYAIDAEFTNVAKGDVGHNFFEV